MKSIYLPASILVAISFAVPGSVAALIASVEFDEPVQTVGANETVVLEATFFNDAASTENLVGTAYSGSNISNGSLVGTGNPYTIKFGGPTTFASQELAPMNIAPGESFTFIFGILQPTVVPVTEGIYVSTSANLGLGGVIYPVGSVQVTVVPEPAGLLLVTLAGTALACRRGVRRTSTGGVPIGYAASARFRA